MRVGVLVSLIIATVTSGQMPQNPSPMVEHTRKHPRLAQETPPGKRMPLQTGALFIPQGVAARPHLPLLVFFHGGTWIPEVAAAQRRMAVISVQIGAGSGVYARAFADQDRFPALLDEAMRLTGKRFPRLILGGWSAGCGAIRELLRQPEVYSRVDSILAIDGIHAGYRSGKPGPLESELETENLDIWKRFAADAIAGRKQLLITHSEIFPGTFASTTETADYLLRETGLERQVVLKWGPVGMQQLSHVRTGNFRVHGYAGNTAPDHVDQLHALPQLLKGL